MKRVGAHAWRQAASCLLCAIVGFTFSAPLGPSEFSGGSVTGPLLTLHDVSGYLFLLAGPDERVSALATKRVARAIPVSDGAALWRDLKQIHHLIAAGLPLTPEERLSPGTPVEIRSGPLVGMRGTVVRAASGRRFVVSVDFIGAGASVMLDDYMLYPAPKAAV